MPGSTNSEDISERFVRSVAAKDSAALKELLAPAVNFRALTPGRAWESAPKLFISCPFFRRTSTEHRRQGPATQAPK